MTFVPKPEGRARSTPSAESLIDDHRPIRLQNFEHSNLLQASLSDSYGEVAILLRPLISGNDGIDDAALAEEVLSQEVSLPPSLSRHEISVIACGLFVAHRNDLVNCSYSYSDVDDLTARFSVSKLPMNTAMIYKTFRSLLDRGLVAEAGRDRSSYGRPADHFYVTLRGRAAFRLAVANARLLQNCRGYDAA